VIVESSFRIHSHCYDYLAAAALAIHFQGFYQLFVATLKVPGIWSHGASCKLALSCLNNVY
jgi:hypothetical protein